MDKQTLQNLLKECGVNLYDTEVSSENDRKIYRIYITHKDGITLDKCAEVTHVLSPILDVDPPVQGQYTLEVSSPGIERPLRTLEHFEASVGEDVKVKLINTDTYIGKLTQVQKGLIVIEEKDGEKSSISLDEIDKARTYFQW